MKRSKQMQNIKKHLNLISVFLAFSFLYSISSYSFYPQGLSPFSSALQELDKRVFLKAEQERKVTAKIDEQRIENRILRVISSYRTGLDVESLKKIPHWIYQESKKYGYDPLLLTALIATESSFNNWAESRKGALGLMQIRPRTGYALASEIETDWAGRPSLFDPATNIALGAYYLDKLLKRFKAMDVALEAYNYGPSRISRYLRQGKLPEKYSRKVFQIYDRIRSQPI